MNKYRGKIRDTSMTKAFLDLVNDSSPRLCIVSMSIAVVLNECLTVCILDGKHWKPGKAIRDGFHESIPDEPKYLAIREFSSFDMLFRRGHGCEASLNVFLRGINCCIVNSTNSTSGL